MSEDSVATRRAWWPAAWIVACVLPLLVWMLLPGNPRAAGLCHDDGVYVSLGKSVVDRGVYRDAHLPPPVETAKYPPGVPLIVASCLAMTPDLDSALTAVRVFNAVFLLVALASFWGILAHEGLTRAGPALVFATGWHVGVVDFARVCMSEIPYLGVSLFTVWTLLRFEAQGERPWRHGILLANLCFVALMLRSFGIILLLAVGLHLLLARRKHTAIRFGIVVLPLTVVLQMFMSAHATPAKGFEDVSVYGLPYSRIFLESLDWVGATIWTNALQGSYYAMTHIVPPARWLDPAGALSLIVLWAGVLTVLPLMMIGARYETRNPTSTSRIRPWHLLILGSVVLILPWPADVARFLIPLVPFFLLMIVRGVERFAGTRSVLISSTLLCIASVAYSIPTRAAQSDTAMAFIGRTVNVEGLLGFSRRLGDNLAGQDAIVACTSDALLASHDDIRGVWGWTITADEHRYRGEANAWRFRLGLQDWVFREYLAARVFYLEQAKSRALPQAYAKMQKMFGTRRPHKTGDNREPLLREMERDRPGVREQYRRLGVTHVVLFMDLNHGNFPYEVLLARLVRELVEEGRADLATELSTETIQVYRIRP